MALRSVIIVLLTVLTSGCGPQVSPDELPALPPVATGEFLAAVTTQLEALAVAVADDPANATKTGRLGMAYLAYSQNEAAETALRRARMLQPRKFEWMYLHAQALARLGRLDEAVVALQVALDRKPEYLAARVQIGELTMQLGDLVTAESLLRSVTDDDPANSTARLALSRLYLRADKPDKAREHLYYLLDQNGHAGSVYFALAEFWRRLGDREKAAEYLSLFERYRGVALPEDDPLMREVAELDRSDKRLLRMAKYLNQSGRSEEAMQLLHLALERNPDSNLTHAALVGAYGAMKQFDKVDEHYRLALESAPATAPLLRNLGRARLYEKRLTEASEALEQSLKLNPHDASAMTWLGLVRLQQRDTEAGLALLNDALAKDPRETLARHNIVSVLRKQGRHEEALEHMKQLVIVEDKLSPRVWRQMGESYLALDRKAEARDALSAAVASAERLNDSVELNRSTRILRGITE